MYLFVTKTGPAMQGDGWIQPRFEQKDLDQADRLEVWATDMSDEGEYCEFRLMKKEHIIISRIVYGF